MDLGDQQVPERQKGLSDHQPENYEENIKTDQGGAYKLGRVFHEAREDNGAVETLFFLQLDGQLIGAYESDFDSRKKRDHQPGNNDPDKGIGIDHTILI